jgi:hypothetical protein
VRAPSTTEEVVASNLRLKDTLLQLLSSRREVLRLARLLLARDREIVDLRFALDLKGCKTHAERTAAFQRYRAAHMHLDAAGTDAKEAPNDASSTLP